MLLYLLNNEAGMLEALQELSDNVYSAGAENSLLKYPPLLS